jgi:hypothetical protein
MLRAFWLTYRMASHNLLKNLYPESIHFFLFLRNKECFPFACQGLLRAALMFSGIAPGNPP